MSALEAAELDSQCDINIAINVLLYSKICNISTKITTASIASTTIIIVATATTIIQRLQLHLRLLIHLIVLL